MVRAFRLSVLENELKQPPSGHIHKIIKWTADRGCFKWKISAVAKYPTPA